RLESAGEVHYHAVYSGACGDLLFEMGKIDAARAWYQEGARVLGRFLAHRHTALLHAAAAALEATDGDRVSAASHLELAERSRDRSGNSVLRVSVELHRGTVELTREAGKERSALAIRLKQRCDELVGEGRDAEIVRGSFD